MDVVTCPACWGCERALPRRDALAHAAVGTPCASCGHISCPLAKLDEELEAYARQHAAARLRRAILRALAAAWYVVVGLALLLVGLASWAWLM